MFSSQITSRPFPSIKILMDTSTVGNIEDDLMFFLQGRDALAYGINLLNLEPGSSILFPSFMCESAITPLRLRGYKIAFLDIEEDLNFCLDKLESAIRHRNIKTVVAVHFFGFPCNIEALINLCKPLNVDVIEDCSHSFLTKKDEKRLGSVGDLAIYSMRKSLPIYDGGALRVNNSRFKIIKDTPISSGRLKGIYYLFSRLLEFLVTRTFIINIYSTGVNNLKSTLRKVSFRNKKTIGTLETPKSINPSIQLIHYLINKEYLEESANIIKDNFHYFIQRTKLLGFKPLYEDLPEGCVPQFAIIIDDEGGLVDWLRDHGIGAARWPWMELPCEVEINKELYPVANKLDNSLVLLPINQSVTRKQQDLIVNCLRTWTLKNK